MIARIALGIVVAGLAACGSNQSSGALTCGPGTHQEGLQCLPDAPVASDGGTRADAGSDADAGAGPAVKDGDPCPDGSEVCSGNHVFACNLLPNDPHYHTLSDVTDCSLLGGTCTMQDAHNAWCTGGGYDTRCDRRTTLSYCWNDHVLASCNGYNLEAFDCRAGHPDWLCHTVDRTDTKGFCGAP